MGCLHWLWTNIYSWKLLTKHWWFPKLEIGICHWLRSWINHRFPLIPHQRSSQRHRTHIRRSEDNWVWFHEKFFIRENTTKVFNHRQTWKEILSNCPWSAYPTNYDHSILGYLDPTYSWIRLVLQYAKLPEWVLHGLQSRNLAHTVLHFWRKFWSVCWRLDIGSSCY